jgi:hypothetical protein
LNPPDSKLPPGQFVTDLRFVRPRACRVSHDRHRGRLQEGLRRWQSTCLLRCTNRDDEFALKSMSIQCVGRLPNRLSCDFSTYPQVPVGLHVTAPVGPAPKVGRGLQSHGRMRRGSQRGFRSKTPPASPRLRGGILLAFRFRENEPENWPQRVPL